MPLDATEQLRRDMENRGRYESGRRDEIYTALDSLGARVEALESSTTVISPGDVPGHEDRGFDIDRVWLAIEHAPTFHRQAAAAAMRRLFPERQR